MFKNILLPLDGSELSEAIIPYARAFAHALDSDITLFTVIDPDSPIVQAQRRHIGDDSSNDEILAAAMTSAQEYLQKHADELPGNVSAKVAEGDAAQQILDLTEQGSIELVAMSTHARGSLMRGLLGSVTDKVLHHTDVPLLIVSQPGMQNAEAPATTPNITDIVVPLDGSKLAESVLDVVGEIASQIDLTIHLIEAVNPKWDDPYYGSVFITETGSIEQELMEEAEGYLADVARPLGDRGLNVGWKAAFGVPHQTITEYAADLDSSIIAMSTRGQSGFTRWLLGSVTENVVRSSGVPVLVIPPNA